MAKCNSQEKEHNKLHDLLPAKKRPLQMTSEMISRGVQGDALQHLSRYIQKVTLDMSMLVRLICYWGKLECRGDGGLRNTDSIKLVNHFLAHFSMSDDV